jgi:hypothetical protein
MAFPVSPTEGQTFTENNTVWIYSAVMGQWNRSVINPLNETLYKFGGSATGNAGEIQYTDGTNLAASPNLLWDNANNELEVGGDVVLDDGGTYTTTLQTITPTAARTISFPDATGTVALVGGSSGQLVYNNAGAQAGAPGSVVGATGDITLGLNGAASAPPLDITGTWFTGGTATTTKPQVLIEPTGATSTAWSTSGTGLGVNAASGFAGRLLDLQTNGTSRAVVTGAGNVGIGTTSPGTNFHLNNNPSWAIPTGGIPNNTQAWISSGTFTGLGIQGGSAGATYLLFADENDGDAGYISYAHSADSMIFGVNAAERARIDSSGRLLVGTSTNTGGSLFQVNDNRIRIATAKTPASATDTGSAGEICWDADYIYVCTATNTWKRTAISTW